MPRALPTVVVAIAAAAVGAGGGFALSRARIASLEAEIEGLRADVTQAQREAGDWRQTAVTERRRKDIAEEEAARLRSVIEAGAASRPPPVSDGTGGTTGNGGADPGAGPGPDEPALAPELWDGKRLRIELERLALTGRRMPVSPLVEACAVAVEKQGPPARKLLHDIVVTDGLSENLRVAAVLVLEKLGDDESLQVIVDAWPGPDNIMFRRLSLRAMAQIPGDVQVPTLLEVYGNPDFDARLRIVAIHGLALRGHERAIGVARERTLNGEPAMRARAVESLHVFARNNGYTDDDLLDVFLGVLANPDGVGQMRLTMLAIEGFWDPRTADALEAFAERVDESIPDDLKARAQRIAIALRNDEPRPEDAGVPRAEIEDE